MKITFYGVRGSIPTPGVSTVRYGGNTPCIVLESHSGQKLVLDAGTGLREASEEFVDYTAPINILISHHHWDHVQGFPFFIPIFSKDKEINIYPGNTIPSHDQAILEQMTKSYFPVKYQDLPSKISIKKTNFNTEQGCKIGDFVIQSMNMNHPDGGSAYKITCDGKVLVYATDNELSAPESHSFHDLNDWIRFCYRADFLVHDAQYLDEEMQSKFGWGHSSIQETLELAELAEVKQLCLFSHDPLRTDEQLDELTVSILETSPPFAFFFAKERRNIQL